MIPKRSRNNKYKKPAVKTIETAVKGTVKVTTITAVSAALLVYPSSARYTGAYFTSSKTSEDPLVLTIKSLVPEVSAVVRYELDQAAMPVPRFGLMGAGLSEEVQGIQDEDAQENVHPRLNSVVARIRLPEDSGFFVEDIIIRTIELRYNNRTAEVIAETARIEGDTLIVEFDGSTVERWLENMEPGSEPEFIVTGEGIRAEDGMRFTFSADDIIEIIAEVVAEIDSIRIYGPGDIEIPLEGESVYKYSFRVLDTEGNEVEGEEVTWSVEGSGVAIDQNGELVVTSDAAPGTITITAVLRSDENITGTLDVELIEPEEEPLEEALDEVPPEEEVDETPPPEEELFTSDDDDDDDAADDDVADDDGDDDKVNEDDEIDDDDDDDAADDDVADDDGDDDKVDEDDEIDDDDDDDDTADDDGEVDEDGEDDEDDEVDEDDEGEHDDDGDDGYDDEDDEADEDDNDEDDNDDGDEVDKGGDDQGGDVIPPGDNKGETEPGIN
jgi:hypothetical protein